MYVEFGLNQVCNFWEAFNTISHWNITQNSAQDIQCLISEMSSLACPTTEKVNEIKNLLYEELEDIKGVNQNLYI